MNTGLDQYMDIFKDAVEDSAAKLTKSFEKILIEVIILFMVIPRKINFTQMGRYGSHVEQTYRKELLKLSTLIVADAYFSTSTFVNGIKKEGFSLISRFRDNACLFYVYAGPRTGKRGRPKTKDGKIDMKNLDLTRMEKMEMKDIEGTAYTLIAYSKALRCKVRLVIWQMPNGKKKLFFSTDTSLSGEEVLLYYRTRFQIKFCFQCFLHITKCCQGNYEGDGNGIFYVFIQVTDDQHLSGETNC